MGTEFLVAAERSEAALGYCRERIIHASLRGAADRSSAQPGPSPLAPRRGLSIRWSIVAYCPLDSPSAGLPLDHLNPNHLVGRQSCPTKSRQHFPRFDGHEHRPAVTLTPLRELYMGFRRLLTQPFFFGDPVAVCGKDPGEPLIYQLDSGTSGEQWLRIYGLVEEILVAGPRGREHETDMIGKSFQEAQETPYDGLPQSMRLIEDVGSAPLSWGQMTHAALNPVQLRSSYRVGTVILSDTEVVSAVTGDDPGDGCLACTAGTGNPPSAATPATI